jgi:hypothetical protein
LSEKLGEGGGGGVVGAAMTRLEMRDDGGLFFFHFFLLSVDGSGVHLSSLPSLLLLYCTSFI